MINRRVLTGIFSDLDNVLHCHFVDYNADLNVILERTFQQSTEKYSSFVRIYGLFHYYFDLGLLILLNIVT